MLNTSKIVNTKFLFTAFFFIISSAACGATHCSLDRLLKTNYARDAICESNGTYFVLRYSPRSRLIWIDSNNKNYRKIIYKLEKNAGPELVGSDHKIKFITRKALKFGDRSFIGLTFSERSMRGNGMGQCGAGSEVYFLALEISNARISQVNRFAVESCKTSIDIAENSPEKGESIQLTKNNNILIRWINYPNFDNPVTGIYDFQINKLTVKENVDPYQWGAF